jgi:DNA topoisomerase-1
VPTFTAFCVTELLERQFEDLVDTDFTAHMEDDLDEIAAGHKAWDDLLGQFFLGDGGKPGLQKRVEEGEVFYPEVPFGSDPETGEKIVIKVGKYGPYLRRGEGGPDNTVSLPRDLPPADLTPEKALQMFKDKAEASDQVPFTRDPRTGRNVYLRHGRFGPYLELEPTEEEKAGKKKPHRVSVPKGVDPEDLTEETAQLLIALPRILGEHPETGEEIAAGLGRYGPYVKQGRDYRNLDSWRKALEIGLDEALEILKEPKKGRRGRQRKVLKELGEHETAAGKIQLLDGRYGPYVTDGETNASLPKGADPEATTLEQAVELLEKKRRAPKKTKKRGRRKARS